MIHLRSEVDEDTKKEIDEREKVRDTVKNHIDELERKIVKCEAEVEVESIGVERMEENIIGMTRRIESGELSKKKKKRVKEEMRKTEEERKRMKKIQELEEKKERVKVMCKRREDLDEEINLKEEYLNKYYTKKRVKEDHSFIKLVESHEPISIYLSHITKHTEPYQT